MLRTEKKQKGQIKLFDNWIPKKFTQLNEELQHIDELLDDDRFYEPIRDKIKRENKSSFRGRPTTPIDTYLRMMYLKFSRNISYKTLVEEVDDSFHWRKFCHLDLVDKVPDMSTLKKLTKRFGDLAIKQINESLVDTAKEKRLIRGKKMRTDTTVVESNIHYPTDASLISDAVRVITRTVKKIQKAGGATRTKFVDRSRSVRKTLLHICKITKRRTGEAKEETLKKVTKLVGIIEDVVERGRIVFRNSRAKARGDHFVQKRREHLSALLDIGQEIVKQTKRVVSGDVHILGRKVSVFDTKARAIQKGKAGKKTEFGRKTVITETDHGVISHYDVLEGNPSDKNLLICEIEYHKSRFGRPPDEVSTDRGYYSAENERGAHELGVKRVSIPKSGRKSRKRKEYESQYWFKRLQRYRAGSEAKISLLKRKHGMRKSLSRGWENASETWIGWSVLACNLWVIGRLV